MSPTTGRSIGAGVTSARWLPASVTTTEPAVLAVISVMVLNSETVPVTRTRCPSATAVGQPLQKTKIPSEVERVGVDVDVLLLEEEALQLRARLVVAGHDALDRDRGARNRRRGAGALHLVDVVHAPVVVGDGAQALDVAGGGSGDVGDVDEERLVGLDGGVAVDRDAEVVRPGRARRDRLAGEALRDVVVVLGRRVVVLRRAVGGRDVERHAAGVRGGGERDGERERGRARRVPLGQGDVADVERRRDRAALRGDGEVVDRRARGPRRCGPGPTSGASPRSRWGCSAR